MFGTSTALHLRANITHRHPAIRQSSRHFLMQCIPTIDGTDNYGGVAKLYSYIGILIRAERVRGIGGSQSLNTYPYLLNGKYRL